MLDSEREQIATNVAELAVLTPGRTGNLSVRRGDHLAITPSGVPYDRIAPEDVPVLSLDGDRRAGDRPPSSETPMHRHIYDRFDAGAIVHVHSPFATTLAVLRQPLPPVHYMIATAGDTVPVADYATYGTEHLAENAVTAMEEADSDACLLASHGLVAVGADAPDAIETAVAIESVARVYCQARALGQPVELGSDEIDRVSSKLEDYGPDEG